MLGENLTPKLAAPSGRPPASRRVGAEALRKFWSLHVYVSVCCLRMEFIRETHEKCAWFMNKKTLANISGIVTKYGRLLNLVQYENGKPSIFGIPVKICPSMDNIGVSAVPVVLGDGTYWATRLVTDENSGIRVYSEATGSLNTETSGCRASCALTANCFTPIPILLRRSLSFATTADEWLIT